MFSAFNIFMTVPNVRSLYDSMLRVTRVEESKAKNDFLSTDMNFMSSTYPVDGNKMNFGFMRGACEAENASWHL